MKINFYSLLKKSTIGLLLFYVGLVFSQVTAPKCVCEEPVNIWYKLSTEGGIQHIVELDMNQGRSFSDGPYIILELADRKTGEIIFVAFPNGGNWTSEQPQDPFLDVLEKEFKSLEDYLRKKQGTEIKKK
tara:strand:- start:27 stop:416 length:390 start_codon:yes stop_codon:yes gene_type:complete